MTIRSGLMILGSTLLLGGCGLFDGDDATLFDRGPGTGLTGFATGAIAPGEPTGTRVGARIGDYRDEISELRRSVGSHAEQYEALHAASIGHGEEYYRTVAALNGELESGARGDPALLGRWEEGRASLEELSGDVTELSQLSSALAEDSGVAVFILQSVQAAYALPGAVDEDYRQLGMLEDETARTVEVIDRLQTLTMQDVSSQTLYVTTERTNMQALQLTIANGELREPGLAAGAGSFAVPSPFAGAALQQGAAPAPVAVVLTPATPSPRPVVDAAVLTTGSIAPAPIAVPARLAMAAPLRDVAQADRPLVIIRFDDPNVAYQEQLYDAVKAAIERRPDAAFELVAVVPSGLDRATSAVTAGQARAHAQSVKRTLVAMGMPPGRVGMDSAQSSEATGSEVHLYVW